MQSKAEKSFPALFMSITPLNGQSAAYLRFLKKGRPQTPKNEGSFLEALKYLTGA